MAPPVGAKKIPEAATVQSASHLLQLVASSPALLPYPPTIPHPHELYGPGEICWTSLKQEKGHSLAEFCSIRDNVDKVLGVLSDT